MKFSLPHKALILLLLATSTNISAQQPWSLEQCIGYALQNNIQVKMQEIAVQVSSNNLQQSYLSMLPSLNGNGAYNLSRGRALDQTTYQFTENQVIKTANLSVSSSMTLFNGFQKINTIKQNRYNFLANQQDVEKLKNDVSLNIASAYLQILLNDELLNVSEKQLETSRLQLGHTKRLVDAGSLPQSNFLQIQSQVANDELQAVNARNQLDLAKIGLQQMLELDTLKSFEIIKPDFSNFSIAEIATNADSIYGEAVDRLPQIKGSEYRLKSAEKGLDVAYGGRSPRISLGASYNSGYSSARSRYGVDTTQIILSPIGFLQNNPSDIVVTASPKTYSNSYSFANQLRDNASSGISLSVVFPIFNGWAVNTNIKNSRLNTINTRYQLEYEKKQLYKEIQQAQADAIASYRQFIASSKAVAAMEESFRSTEERYNLGLMTFVEYSTAKDQLSRAQSEMLQAKYNYIFKTKVLDFYRGVPVKL